jgi:hypothetical protein
MSARAIVVATQASLAAFLNDEIGELSGVQVDGRPPPKAGQLYYAVWWSKGTNVARQEGETIAAVTEFLHTVTVTITAKLGVVPQDRRGKKVSDPNELFDLAEALFALPTPEGGLIHGNYALMDAANALIPGTVEYCEVRGGTATVNGFAEPLLAIDYGPLMPRDAKWVSATPGTNPDVYSIDVRFGYARRMQTGIA